MIHKVDIEKAYDKLEWDFITKTLLDAGLLGEIVETAMRCVLGGTFIPLSKGQSTDTISLTRGV